jgi:hypothetical protein
VANEPELMYQVIEWDVGDGPPPYPLRLRRYRVTRRTAARVFLATVRPDGSEDAGDRAYRHPSPGDPPEIGARPYHENDKVCFRSAAAAARAVLRERAMKLAWARRAVPEREKELAVAEAFLADAATHDVPEADLVTDVDRAAVAEARARLGLRDPKPNT